LKVAKTYGEMWKNEPDNDEYTVSLLNIMSGISKDFILEINVPHIDRRVDDINRNI